MTVDIKLLSRPYPRVDTTDDGGLVSLCLDA